MQQQQPETGWHLYDLAERSGKYIYTGEIEQQVHVSDINCSFSWITTAILEKHNLKHVLLAQAYTIALRSKQLSKVDFVLSSSVV